MKARNILIIVLLSILYSFNITAQEQIPANSKTLSGSQKRTLAYAKRLLNNLDDKIALPLEVNMLLGDTITKEQYYATPTWDKAYFMEVDGFTSAIILPINVKTPKGEINSILNIYNNKETQYYRFVETMIKCSILEDNIECYIISNINGILLQNIISKNGSIAEVQNGVVGYANVLDGKSKKSHYDKKSMHRAIIRTYEAGKWSPFKLADYLLDWQKASPGSVNH